MKRLAAVVLLAVLALPFHASAAGTVSSPNGWGWWAPTKDVAVVGDSLTYMAEHGGTINDPAYQYHDLTDALAGVGARSDVAARSAADTRSLRMWGGWESAPDVIVMALGTNDRRYEPSLGFPLSLGTSQWNIVNYLNRWLGACPVLVGIVELPNRWRHDVYGPAWNRWLRYLADLRGGVFVDWAGYSAGHPDWFTSDQLHMTAAGQAAYRQAIVDGVGKCPP